MKFFSKLIFCCILSFATFAYCVPYVKLIGQYEENFGQIEPAGGDFGPLDSFSFQPKHSKWLIVGGDMTKPAKIIPTKFSNFIEYVKKKYLEPAKSYEPLEKYEFAIRSEKLDDKKAIQTYRVVPFGSEKPSAGPVVFNEKNEPILFSVVDEGPPHTSYRNNYTFAFGPDKEAKRLIQYSDAKDLKIVWAGDVNNDGYPDFVIRNEYQETMYLSRTKDEYVTLKYNRDSEPCGEKVSYDFIIPGHSITDDCPVSQIGKEYFGVYKDAKGNLGTKKFHIGLEVDASSTEDWAGTPTYYYNVSVKFQEPEEPLFGLIGVEIKLGTNAKTENIRVSSDEFKVGQKDYVVWKDGKSQLLLRQGDLEEEEESSSENSSTVAETDQPHEKRETSYHASLIFKNQDNETELLEEKDTLSDEAKNSWVQLDFAGDINGDGIPDFMLSSGWTYHGTTLYFFISKKSGKEIKFEKRQLSWSNTMC